MICPAGHFDDFLWRASASHTTRRPGLRAGTHNHKCCLLRHTMKKGNEHCLSHEFPGVAMSASAHAGVPAFAGTTPRECGRSRRETMVVRSRCRRKPKSPLVSGPSSTFSVLQDLWSGRRGSNPRPRPWQGRALPLSYTRIRCRRSRADSGRAMPNAAPECNSKPRVPGTGRIAGISGDRPGKSGQKPDGGVPPIANWGCKRQLGLEKC